MKKYLCYDTNDAVSGRVNVDSRGVLRPNATVPSTNGAPFMQLVTDGEGNVNWEGRLAYESNTFVNVLPEQSVTFERINTTPYSKTQISEEYIASFADSIQENGDALVTFDGAEYRCTIYAGREAIGSGRRETIYVLGNWYIFGEAIPLFAGEEHGEFPDTGEPFCVCFYIVRNWTKEDKSIIHSQGMIATNIPGNTHTISLSIKQFVKHPLEDKYIPKNMRIQFEGNRDGIVSCNTTYGELLEFLNKGLPIAGTVKRYAYKGSNGWLSEVCSIEYITALDEDSIIIVFPSYVLPMVEDYGLINITDVKYCNIVYRSDGNIISNFGNSSDGPA